MPPIQTAEDAIAKADAFLSKFYSFKRPLTAKKEDNSWLVIFDVGIIRVEKVQLKLDAGTGSIMELSAQRDT